MVNLDRIVLTALTVAAVLLVFVVLVILVMKFFTWYQDPEVKEEIKGIGFWQTLYQALAERFSGLTKISQWKMWRNKWAIVASVTVITLIISYFFHVLKIELFLLGCLASGILLGRFWSWNQTRRARNKQAKATTPPPPAAGTSVPPPTGPPATAPNAQSKKRRVSKKTESIFIGLGILIAYAVSLTWAIQTGSWRVAIPLIILVVSSISMMVIAYVGADYSMWFTFVREGTLKAVVAGPLNPPAEGEYVRFLANIKGYYFNKVSCKMEKADDGEDEAGWFTQLTGLTFVSWIYPIRHIYTFPILKTRLLKDRNMIPVLKDRIEVDKKATTVNELLFIIERPFYLHEVDLLGDKTKVDFLGNGIYRVWDPYKLLFELRGNFFGKLDGIVSAYIISKFKPLSYGDLAQAKNDLKPEDLMTDSDLAYAAYDVQKIIGLIPESIVIEEFSESEGDPAMQAAIEAESIAKKEAAARIAKAAGERLAAVELARGQRQVRILEAQGEARAIERLAEANRIRVGKFVRGATKNGVSPNVAGLMFRDEDKYANLRGLRTLADGNNDTTLLLQDTPDTLPIPVGTPVPASVPTVAPPQVPTTRKPQNNPPRNNQRRQKGNK